MITFDTLISRRKRISALRTRFEKAERALLKEFDMEQILLMAHSLSTVIKTLKSTALSKKAYDLTVEEGNYLRTQILKISSQYASDTVKVLFINVLGCEVEEGVHGHEHSH